MKNQVLCCFTLMMAFWLVGCEIEIGHNSSNEGDVSNLAYELALGSQSDIFHQKIEVIQDDGSYYEFLASIPSMSGNEPMFDSETDTLITIISNAVGCSYYPLLESVTREQNTIMLEVVNVRVKSPETCNPSPEPSYSYKIVKLEKTHTPISINIKNEG